MKRQSTLSFDRRPAADAMAPVGSGRVGLDEAGGAGWSSRVRAVGIPSPAPAWRLWSGDKPCHGRSRHCHRRRRDILKIVLAGAGVHRGQPRDLTPAPSCPGGGGAANANCQKTAPSGLALQSGQCYATGLSTVLHYTTTDQPAVRQRTQLLIYVMAGGTIPIDAKLST